MNGAARRSFLAWEAGAGRHARTAGAACLPRCERVGMMFDRNAGAAVSGPMAKRRQHPPSVKPPISPVSPVPEVAAAFAAGEMDAREPRDESRLACGERADTAADVLRLQGRF
jgi:hypothetical protein